MVPRVSLSLNRDIVSELAACVWIPLFALRAEELRRPELSNRPAGLLAPDDARRLWHVSPVARRYGVKAGITVSQAIGLCPSLTLCEPDPVYYDEQFARLLLALSNVSPVVEPVELGKVYVGVDGFDRLYGNADQQLKAIRDAIAGRHLAPSNRRRWQRRFVSTRTRGKTVPGWASWARLGWARGKFAAWVAAAKAKPGEWTVVSDSTRSAFLAMQSVAALPIQSDTHHRLWQLGIKTLADVARLPETALAAQFGNEGRRAWRLAAGVADDPVVGRPLPEPIVAALDYLTPVADRGMLAHALGILVDRALKHPQRVGWRVHKVQTRAILEGGASWMIEATLKDPSADREHITAPLRVHLERTPPVGAVEHLSVEFVEFAPGTTELQLFARDARSSARARRRHALRNAVREIRTRLKRSALYHVIEVHPWSRLPERRYALIDFEP